MKTEAIDKDARDYVHIQEVLLYHQTLLGDEERNKLFYDAIKRRVTSETRVLDIGAGSGVWAIAAAKLGAKKVTAVEADSVMVPVILAHARENGVAEKIEIVHGQSLEINLRHKYDLIISETIGNQAFDENIIGTMIDAQRRFLARDGLLIPQKVALKAAPAHLETETETPLGVPIKATYIRNLGLNLSSKIADKDRLHLLAEPLKLIEVDLRHLTSEPSFHGLVGKWKLKDVSRANVIALWAECELTDGVVLDTWNTVNWLPVVCRFRPLGVKRGELEFTLNIDAKLYHWAVRSAERDLRQSYTPAFAYTKIKLDSKYAPRKRKPRKIEPAVD